MVSFFLLRGKPVIDFERVGDLERIHLEDGVLIESSSPQMSLRIVVNGVEVLRDDAVYCPVTTGSAAVEKIACYSISPRTLKVPIPPDWEIKEVVAFALSANGRETASFDRSADTISPPIEARRL